jgi:DNA topoisomerase-2
MNERTCECFCHRNSKGLGSNTPEEAQEYFSQISKHQKEFQWTGPQDDEAIEMAFSKKKADARKDWLRNYQARIS